MANPFLLGTSNSMNSFSSALSRGVNYLQNGNQQKSTNTQNNNEKWYKGDQPTMRETVGRLFEITLNDQATGSRYQNDFMSMLSDPTSMYYSPYLQSTNQALKELASYGIDTSNINDDWFKQYKWLENYYNYGTTNTPTSPGKKASLNQKAAYAYWQVAKQNELTKSAQSEWQAAKDEAAYWANRADRNYSDDDIIGIVYKDFAKKYPTLAKMDESIIEPGNALLELNSGINYSRDALYGTIWAARNGGGTGDFWQDMAHSAIGDRNVWHENADIIARLDSTNKNTYAPYTVGSTLDDAGLYYGKASFDRKWLEENRPDERTATKKEIDMWNKVATAVDFTESAQAEAVEAKNWLDRQLSSAKTQEQAENIMKKFDARLDSQWKHLKQMDDSLKKSGSLIGTSDAINYSYNDVRNMVYDKCGANANLADGYQTQENNGIFSGTAQEKEAARTGDKTVADAGIMIDDIATEAERNLFLNAPTTSYNQFISGLTLAMKDSIGTIVRNEQATTEDYTSNMVGLSTDYNANLTAQKQLDTVNAEIESMRPAMEALEQFGDLLDPENYGNLVNVVNDPNWDYYKNILNKPQYARGDQYQQEKYNNALQFLYEKANPGVYSSDMDLIREKGLQYWDILQNNKELPTVTKEEVDRYEDLNMAKGDLEKTLADTADAKTAYETAQEMWDARIALYDRAGIDSTGLKAAKAVVGALNGFAQYDATEWLPYNYFDMAAQEIGKNATYKDVIAKTEKDVNQAKENVENAKWMLEYLDENKIQIPDNYKNNINRYIEKNQRILKDYDYYTLQDKSDFSDMVKKGRELEDKEKRRALIPGLRPEGPTYAGEYETAWGLDLSDFYDIMTDAEKDTFYYLYGKEGKQAANDYYNYLADYTYGILHTRNRQQIEENAANEVNGGLLSAIWANAKAIVSAPIEGIAGLAYDAFSALSGEEYNPNYAGRSFSQYSSAVNSETMQAIKENLGEKDAEGEVIGDTFLSQLASGAYEILYNRGRSAVNALAFGGVTSGIKSALLKEIVGAAPMAMGAADSAIAKAKDNGAEDWQAYAIGGVTLLAEDLTEGLTYGNISEAINGAGDNVVRSVKDLLKNWLTSSGVEEMIGESINDIVENIADSTIMGALSEHSKLVNSYIEELGLNPDNPVDVQQAEELARKDELAGVLHTALISYLSPGLDVFTASVRDQVHDFNEIRKATRMLQKRGNPVSMSDVRKEYMENKAKALRQAEQQANGQQTEAQAPEQAEVVQSTAAPQRPMSDTDSAFLSDLSALDAAERSDSTTQTAAVGALFGAEENKGTAKGDTAKAAAVSMTNLFGDMRSAIRGIKGIITGANQSKTNVADVKSALQTAALSVGSQANKVMNSNAFNQATIQEKAVMLAQTAAQDAVNENVQKEIAASVHEARVAEQETIIIKNGALDAVNKLKSKADDALRTLTQARDDLAKRQAEKQAKADAFVAAANEMTANPTSDNANAMKGALAELDKSIAVEQEYEQHLENTEQDTANTQNEYFAARENAMADIRQQAEANIQQEDQVRADIAAQQAEQERIAAEQQAEAKRQEQLMDLRSGKLSEEEARAKLERYAAEKGYDGEYAKQFVDTLMETFKNGNMQKINKNKPLNATEGYLMTGYLSRRFDVNVVIDNNMTDDDNGSYDPNTNTITLNGKLSAGQVMVEFALHELTHSLEKTQAYQQYSDFILNDAFKSEAEMNAAVARMMKSREEAGRPVDETQAKREIVAEFTRLMLNDRGTIERMVDAGLGGRFRNALHNVNQMIRNTLGGKWKQQANPGSQTFGNVTVDQLRRAERMLEKAIRERSREREKARRDAVRQANTPTAKLERQAAPVTTANNGDTITGEVRGGTITKEDDVEYSTGSWTDDEKVRVRSDLVKRMTADGMTQEAAKEKADRWIQDVNSIAAIILKDQHRLDYDVTDPAKRFLKPNNDYYYTLDASTLCAKRLLFQGTFDTIQRMLPNTPLLPEDLIDLGNLMREMGYETPCGICYVESRRRWLGKYANEWLTNYSGEYIPTIQELTTSDGLEGLRKHHKEAYDSFIEAMNAKGSANPKVVQLRTDYRGDIMEMTEGEVQKVKDIGGLRVQSFSDFEVPHLIDMMQAVLDMASRGLTSQAYTKVPAFAAVFGGTGIKINLSEIGKGSGVEIGNGLSFDDIASMPYEKAKGLVRLLYDDVEGMPHAQAIALRNQYSKDVGTILVGMNDAHIIAAMADGEVDFIIPFHKSGWSDEELRKMPVLNGYSDYTSTQNERIILGKKTVTAKKDVGQKAVDNWIAANGESHPGYKVTQGENGKFTITYEEGYETESFQKHKERTGESFSNFEPVGAHAYWDFSKTGTENAKAYLEMCKKEHRVPKFSQFLVDNGDGSFSLPQGDDFRSTAIRNGYWKTLIDFKMYDNEGNGAAQETVTPNVNMDAAQDVLNGYTLDRTMPNGQKVSREDNNTLPVAQEVAERYVQMYKDAHPGREYSAGDFEMSEAQKQQTLQDAYGDYEKAVARGDMEAAQQDVNYAADAAGYVVEGFHGTLNGGYTIFDKRKAHIGGNSGAGFYFSSNQADSEANYADVEGADNHFKVDHLVEKIQDYIAESGENEYAGVPIPEDASYEELEEIAKEMLQGNPQTYHVRLNPGRAYIRNFNNSTNLLEDAYAGFDESNYSRSDFDSDEEYDEAVSEGRSDHIYEAISDAVYNGIADVDSNFEIVSNVDYESIINDLATQAMDYDMLTWDDVMKVVGDQYIDAIVGDGEESADASAEITRAIVEAFGFDSIEDHEVSKKFNQLKNMGNAGDTVHYIMFRPDQIKLADPVTYRKDENGNNVPIPLDERFKAGNNDIRYSSGEGELSDEQKVQALRAAGVDISFEERDERQSEQRVKAEEALAGWDGLSDKTPNEVRKLLNEKDANYPTLEQWIHNTYEKNHPRTEEVKIKKQEIIDFFADDAKRIKDESRSLIDGWAKLVKETNDLDPLNYDRKDARWKKEENANKDFSNKNDVASVLFAGRQMGDSSGYDFPNNDTKSTIRISGKTITKSFNWSSTHNIDRKLMGKVLTEADTLLRDAIYVGSHPDYAHSWSDANIHYLVSPLYIDGQDRLAIFAVHDSLPENKEFSERAYVVELVLMNKKDGALENHSAQDELGNAVNLPQETPSKVNIADILRTVNTDRLRFFKKEALANKSYASGNHDLTDQERQQALIEAGVITQEDADIINGEMSTTENETARPLEGQNPTMSTGQGPAQRAFGADDGMLQSSDEIDRFAKAVVSAQNSYFPDTNNEQVQRAINWIRSLKATPNSDGFAEALQEVTRDNFDYRSADGQARMVAVMGMAVAKNDVMAQVALADAFNRQGTDLGRALQSRKLFKLMTPEGRIGTLQKMLQNTQDEMNAKGTNVELKFSDWIYRAASAATEEGDMQKVMQAAAQELAEQLPANWKDRIRSIRMLSMLGNPRTHIRNVVGNALFVPVVSLKNKLGAIAELGVKQDERTKTLSPFLNKAVREFVRQDAETMKNELTGEAKYNEENAVQREHKAFKGLLQSVIDFNSNMLEKEDWTFLKGHYKRALGGWMQANGYTADRLRNDAALLEKGRAYAIQEAQKATYRDFNQLAATMNDVSRKGGIAGFLVDAVLPFKKTPANILRRGIEYSPVGIMKSLTADLYHLKQYNDFQDGKLKAMPDKAISPTQFIDKLCSGLSGTAIMAVGALLSSAGIVSCGLDDDEDKLEKEKGNQEYAFKFSILGHDYTFTMDWAAPMSMPFFVGAAIQEQLAQQEGFDVQELINAFGNITEPVFNLSMLDGVNTLFKTSQYDDTNNLTQIGAKIASNYVTSYVPSLLGAIARTVDDKRRKAFVESGKGTGVLGTFRYAMEQTENKIPGLSQTNIPYRDVWGNAETSGLVERILENFILPGYISEYKNDPILNEMDRLYTLTGDAGMIPSDPEKSVTYKKQKHVLNAEQWDEYKAVRGQTAYEMLNNLIQTDDYKTADANAQAQMIKDAWSYADSVGKSAIIPDYELTSKGSNPAQSIAKDAKINGYKDEMIKALNAGDWEAYDTMVEALHQSEVEDGDIKTKIGNTYRDQYKDAYKKDDWQRMSEIEDILDNTGFSFDIGAWEKQVDQSR